MKYEAINELPNFYYHDAIIKKIDFMGQNRRMVWEVENISLDLLNSQNPFDEYMNIGNAVMIFEYAHIESIVFEGYQMYDSDNVLIKSKEAVIASPKEYADILKRAVTDEPVEHDGGLWYPGEGNYTEIFDLESFTVIDDGRYRYKASFNIMFNRGFGEGNSIVITIMFSKSIIKWDDFSGKAWYATEEWKKHSEESEKSWEKFIAEYKIGDIIDVKMPDHPPFQFPEILPNLCGRITNVYNIDDIFAGEICKVKIADISKDFRQISLELIK